MDLTELTDMSDQELAEVFADSDEETHGESPAGKEQRDGLAAFVTEPEPTSKRLLDSGGFQRFEM